jgi:hypothetical protein
VMPGADAPDSHWNGKRIVVRMRCRVPGGLYPRHFWRPHGLIERFNACQRGMKQKKQEWPLGEVPLPHLPPRLQVLRAHRASGAVNIIGFAVQLRRNTNLVPPVRRLSVRSPCGIVVST